MSFEFKELPGWLFDGDEVSAGVYKIWAKDSFGSLVEAVGGDEAELIEKCKREALEIMLKTKSQ
jgi:hypothetical protein